MAVPGSKEARRFFRCASQRFEEAGVLLKFGFTTGAVYLAGYSVECTLKALIVSIAPASRAEDVGKMFRGNKAHDYDWLKSMYREGGGASAPEEVNRAFTLVRDWTTDLRYSTEAWEAREALRFLRAVGTIMQWAGGRL